MFVIVCISWWMDIAGFFADTRREKVAAFLDGLERKRVYILYIVFSLSGNQSTPLSYTSTIPTTRCPQSPIKTCFRIWIVVVFKITAVIPTLKRAHSTVIGCG